MSSDSPSPTDKHNPAPGGAAAPARKRYPPGIRFIIGNEACERFSFYGMKAILWVYMVSLFSQQLARDAAEHKATSRMHLFIAGVYAFPMIGALIADRLAGKYQTILWLSLVYCAGNATVALGGGTEGGLYLGLALIALGSGGIKPCVSALVGDQFSKENSELIPGIYQIFYFTINFGSFFATLSIPFLYKHFGPKVAFGVPGILMFLATAIFFAGRKRFTRIAPKPGGKLGLFDALASSCFFLTFGSLTFTSGEGTAVMVLVSALFLAAGVALFVVRQRIQEDSGFLSVLVYAIRNQRLRQPGMGYFDVAKERFGQEAAEGPPAVLRIVGVFATVAMFWALFDQHSSTWINQASKMDLGFTLPLVGSVEFLPAQTPALNPLLVMLIIPFLNFVVYPPLERLGVKLTALRKMTLGMFLAAASFAVVALIQVRIEAIAAAGQKVSVGWQMIPYVLITMGEVLVSATGLEFAYTQAPRSMKSTILGFWLLTVTVGNLFVAFIAHLPQLSLVSFFWLFTGLMAAAALVFGVVAYFFKVRTYLQDDAART